MPLSGRLETGWNFPVMSFKFLSRTRAEKSPPHWWQSRAVLWGSRIQSTAHRRLKYPTAYGKCSFTSNHKHRLKGRIFFWSIKLAISKWFLNCFCFHACCHAVSPKMCTEAWVIWYNLRHMEALPFLEPLQGSLPTKNNPPSPAAHCLPLSAHTHLFPLSALLTLASLPALEIMD